jgi:predicted helicase
LHEDALFRLYSLGVATNRDEWVYDFDRSKLDEKMRRFVLNYNSEVFRWSQEVIPPHILNSQEDILKYISNFVNSNPAFVKWTDRLKEALQKNVMLKYDLQKIRKAIYRPFCIEFLYFDSLLNQRRYQQYLISPTPSTELENIVVCLTTLGSEKPFMVLATNVLPDLHLVGAGAGTQCFPFYTYAEDGSNRRENITDWALKQFQSQYGSEVTKWDIFHYVYGLLHHPQYRELYKENLKRDLPHIPLLLNLDAFAICVRIGKQLMELHVNYEQVEEYPLRLVSDRNIPYLQRLRVEKMKLSADKSALIYSPGLTLEGIPPECFQYRLGNRSALEWVIDQYQVSVDKRSGIESDPNQLDTPDYIVRLVGKVVQVSMETVRLVNELAQSVTAADWLPESVALNEDAAV